MFQDSPLALKSYYKLQSAKRNIRPTSSQILVFVPEVFDLGHKVEGEGSDWHIAQKLHSAINMETGLCRKDVERL